MRLVASAVVVALGSTAMAQPALSPPGETPPIETPRRGAPPLDSGTVTGQVLLAGVLGVGGALAGGYLGFAMVGANTNSDNGAVVPIILGLYLGGSLGVAGGTYLVGNNATAEGSFGAAYGGALLGGLAGIAGAAIVDKALGYGHDDAKPLLETTAVVGGWIGGSLVGYYLTRHSKASSELASLHPTFRADSHGMALGVGATF